MATTALIDYGCHSFTFRLSAYLQAQGFDIRYFANASLESPNLKSLPMWKQQYPELLRVVSTKKPYGKLNLGDRLRGEIEWTRRCIEALEAEEPASIVASCLPLTVVARVQSWARRRGIPFVYWLQDLQSIAIGELLGKRLGMAGKVLGKLAGALELSFLRRSSHVITIARAHEAFLPISIRNHGRFTTLENWANIEDIPVLPSNNAWSQAHGLQGTRNIVYSGTLGFKHDLTVFLALAAGFQNEADVRIVVVSTGAAADHVRKEARLANLSNLIVLPFQPYNSLPSVLASASVFIAPLDPSAGSFCVPSKLLSYLCAGRPSVLAIDHSNPAAQMLAAARAGTTVTPGDADAFVGAAKSLMSDAGLRVAMGKSARSYAESAFAIDNVSGRFLRILESAGVTIERSTQVLPSFAAAS